MLDAEVCRRHAAAAARPRFRGRVEVVAGVIVEAGGVPAAMGELCRIDRGPLGPVAAEVVGFRGARTLLMPHGELEGIAPRQPVTGLGRPFTVPVGPGLLGRLVNGFGAPLDGGPPIPAAGPDGRRRVRAEAPPPLSLIHI